MSATQIRTQLAGLVAFGFLAASPGIAQSVGYVVIDLGEPPGSGSTTPTGINDKGEVVGWAYFSQSPMYRSWTWSAQNGMALLPAPPGNGNYRAMAVNDAGTIVGDGGGWGGEAWRFAGGSYQILEPLPGNLMIDAVSINATGDVVGASLVGVLTFNTYLDSVGSGMSLVLGDSSGTFINDAGQIVGYLGSKVAYRYTPGIGVEFLDPLGQRTLTWARSINSAGDVVGTAAFANGNGNVPFLFSDAGGMQLVGGFTGSARGIDINDRGEVIGMYEPVTRPWIWSEEEGLRFLDALIEPGSNLSLTSVARINDLGQIIGYGHDIFTGQRRPVLLTPFPEPRPPISIGDVAPAPGTPRGVKH